MCFITILILNIFWSLILREPPKIVALLLYSNFFSPNFFVFFFLHAENSRSIIHRTNGLYNILCNDNNSILCILTHPIYTKFTAVAVVVALPAVALVIGDVHTLSPAALRRVLALVLASAAIVFVIHQVHTLVVATLPPFSMHFLAHLLVLMAMAGRSRVFHILCQESAHAPRRQRHRRSRSFLDNGCCRWRYCLCLCRRCRLFEASHGDGDGQSHGYGYYDHYFDDFHGFADGSFDEEGRMVDRFGSWYRILGERGGGVGSWGRKTLMYIDGQKGGQRVWLNYRAIALKFN